MKPKIFTNFFSEFCPVNCDYEKDMMCPGPWDPKTGEQTGPDYCMPYKNGECAAHCPKQCGEKEMLCPGKMDPKGCQEPDFCHYGSKYFSNATWSLIGLLKSCIF